MERTILYCKQSIGEFHKNVWPPAQTDIAALDVQSLYNISVGQSVSHNVGWDALLISIWQTKLDKQYLAVTSANVHNFNVSQ